MAHLNLLEAAKLLGKENLDYAFEDLCDELHPIERPLL